MTKLKITLVKSVIGSTVRQKKTVESLGLGKINSSVIQVDTPDIRGKVKKVEHLVSVEKIEA
ncbi:MAG: 50S ribosomal protein L30 [Clostridia bacterium]|nr:50S ribosomal protein L30 [Clostridia bacterium]